MSLTIFGMKKLFKIKFLEDIQILLVEKRDEI